jgi:acyl-CoA thioesterase FadM
MECDWLVIILSALAIILFFARFPLFYTIRVLRCLLFPPKRPNDPLATQSLRMKVALNECDMNLHMNNGVYLTTCDFGRVSLLSSFGLGMSFLFSGVSVAAGGEMVRFRRPLNLWSSYTLTTRIAAADDKWVYVEHQMIQKKRVAVAVWVKVMFKKGGKILAPQDLLEYAGYSNKIKLPSLSHAQDQWLTAEGEMVASDA